MPTISPERFKALRKLSGLNQDQMGDLLGVSGKYVGMIERGEKPIEEQSSLGLLFRSHEGSAALEGRWSGTSLREEPVSYRTKPRPGAGSPRMIPVVSWAHAGTAESFEELPKSWQDMVPTECRDERAFAVRLIGDSMAPLFVEGDTLVLQPSREIYSECLAVVRLANDGILFRRVERRGEKLLLVPLNLQYSAEEFSGSEISWAYPLWGMWRQVCK